MNKKKAINTEIEIASPDVIGTRNDPPTLEAPAYAKASVSKSEGKQAKKNTFLDKSG